jgi:gliding motility-associated-like protein
MKIQSALLALGLFISIQLQGQILPPEFLCVRGDTLFWNTPTNNCGSFINYEVYGSQSQQGPYVLLTGISNASQDFYFHVNPSGEVWYFYLLSNYNCPGQMAIPSDTLDNRPPGISPIENVTVENGEAVVNWRLSPSPEVYAYVIYRETPIGVIPVDTVFSGNTYTDPSAKPEEMSESYFVNALDRCGNTSIFDAKHRTIFLEATVNPCRQSVTLNWNIYQNWTNGIGEQQLWVGVNGAPPAPVVMLGGGAVNSYELKDINDGDDYCFVLQAIEANTGIVSRSNEVCLTANIVQAIRDMYMKNVTVTPDNQVKVIWAWNTAAEINEIQILRSDQNLDYKSIATEAPQFPLAAESSYTDATAMPTAGAYFYKIQTQDDCDSLAVSTYGSTIFLTVTGVPGNINRINWSAFSLENAIVTTYEVFKIVNGTESLITSAGVSARSFDSNFDPTIPGEAQACYYVVATATLTTPDGSEVTIQSRSNTACASQKARVYVPNAFVPEGFNQEFKPLIVLGDVAEYKMNIYDRYGQEVFFSANTDEGWNGKKEGKELPQGIYVYVIRVTQTNGKIVEKKGSVLLLR